MDPQEIVPNLYDINSENESESEDDYHFDLYNLAVIDNNHMTSDENLEDSIRQAITNATQKLIKK